METKTVPLTVAPKMRRKSWAAHWAPWLVLVIPAIIIAVWSTVNHFQPKPSRGFVTVDVYNAQGRMQPGTQVVSDIGVVGEVVDILSADDHVIATWSVYKDAPLSVTTNTARLYLVTASMHWGGPVRGIEAQGIDTLVRDPYLYVIPAEGNQTNHMVALKHPPMDAQPGVLFTVTLRNARHLQAPFEVINEQGVRIGEGIEIVANVFPLQLKLWIYDSTDVSYRRNGAQYFIKPSRVRWDGGSGFEADGIETILGPPYLKVLPGDGEVTDTIVGVEDPLVVEDPSQWVKRRAFADEAGSLKRRSGVYLNGWPVGLVESVLPTPNANRVCVTFYLRKGYELILCENSRLADTGGPGLKLDWPSDVLARAPTIEETVSGGLSIFTPMPPACGRVLGEEDAPSIAPKAEENWRDLKPSIPVGTGFYEHRDDVQRHFGLHRVQLNCTEDVIGNRLQLGKHEYHGYVLQTDQGLLGPKELLTLPEFKLTEAQIIWSVDGRTDLPFPPNVIWKSDRLALVETNVGGPEWPMSQSRPYASLRPLNLIVDASLPPLLLMTEDFETTTLGRVVRSCLSLDPSWHSVPAFDDTGFLVGMILKEEMSYLFVPLAR